jgi:primase-polymerase (primpol)-like protein
MGESAIPAELRDRPQWVGWRYMLRAGKWTKVPVNPLTGGRAKSNDPFTWETFTDALTLCEGGAADGIGYMRCTRLSRPFFGQNQLGWRVSIGLFALAS